MNQFRKIARPIAFSVVFSILGFSIQLPAYAAIIGTDAAIQAEKSDADRSKIKTLLARSEMQQKLVAAGVNPEQVSARVDAMSNTEITALAGQLDKAAAGGDALGIALLVFLALVVSDLMGWTDIFPFTKKGAWKK